MKQAPLAQLDRVFGYEPKGRGFESPTACQCNVLSIKAQLLCSLSFFLFALENLFCQLCNWIYQPQIRINIKFVRICFMSELHKTIATVLKTILNKNYYKSPIHIDLCMYHKKGRTFPKPYSQSIVNQIIGVFMSDRYRFAGQISYSVWCYIWTSWWVKIQINYHSCSWKMEYTNAPWFVIGVKEKITQVYLHDKTLIMTRWILHGDFITNWFHYDYNDLNVVATFSHYSAVSLW